MSEQDSALVALAAAAPEVSSVLRGATDLDRRTLALEWTAGEVAAHLVSILRAYTAAEQGLGPVGPDLMATATNNARLIALTNESTPAGLADAYDESIAAFIATNQERARNEPVAFYGELTITASAAAGLMLSESLVHGWDLATALGGPWSIDPDHARIALLRHPEIFPQLVKADVARGFTATYEIRIRGAQPYCLVFDNGALTVSSTACDRRVDCRISADPVTFLMGGRVPQWKSLLTGKVFASGRRPWLGNRLGQVLQAP